MRRHKLIEQINKLICQYYHNKKTKEKFIPGKTLIRYSGGYFGALEAKTVLRAFLEGWLGLGTCGEKFDEKLAQYLGAKKTLLTNSGSSASLLAMAALTSRLRPNPLRAGDEVVTPACTFATTVSAIVRQGLIPRFIDVDINTLNPSLEMITDAIRKKTKAIFIPHTLGNPNNMPVIMRLAKQHNLIVIEDNCDALGSEYKGKKTGVFGHLATLSFYPAHHLTTAGEGGSVIINDMELYRIVLALRNWGRGCWCLPSEKNSLGACKNRFNYTLAGNIPIDHRYLFIEMGYNLKPVELQAAMGLIQLKRFPNMAKKRRYNFKLLYDFFKQYESFFYLPKSIKGANPCWFAFPLTIREEVPFTRNEILLYLAEHKIEGRSLFAGNITRHPAIKGWEYKISGKLTISDIILKNTFFIGVWSDIQEKQINYIKSVFQNYLKKF